jgi:hypothetical protein
MTPRTHPNTRAMWLDQGSNKTARDIGVDAPPGPGPLWSEQKEVGVSLPASRNAPHHHPVNTPGTVI